MKLISFLDKKLEEIVLVLSLFIMLLLVFAQVITRYVFNFSMGWSVELSRYILIWIAWISASYAIQKGSHIRVEFLPEAMKGNFKKVFDLLILLIWISFTIFLAVYGTLFVMYVGERVQTSPSLGIRMSYVYLAVPIAGLLMSIRLIQQIYYLFKS